ncbi:hypothetical protein JOD43_000280 [Pullulanibacillus pueri]|nr:hypothetical protein [Pullulanibacillus pueri]
MINSKTSKHLISLEKVGHGIAMLKDLETNLMEMTVPLLSTAFISE